MNACKVDIPRPVQVVDVVVDGVLLLTNLFARVKTTWTTTHNPSQVPPETFVENAVNYRIDEAVGHG